VFELEAGSLTLDVGRLNHPLPFGSDGYYNQISAVALLNWEEHCTECVAPACYSTCDLYESRKDGKCRRFSDGIVPVTGTDCILAPAVRIKFKRWGSLMAKSDIHMVDKESGVRLAGQISYYERFARWVPDGQLTLLGRKAPVTRLTHRLKMGIMRKASSNATTRPTHFVVEMYNPSTSSYSITLTVRASNGERAAMPYQKMLEATPGMSRARIPFEEIEYHLQNGVTAFHTLTPNVDYEIAKDGDVDIYFGLVGYVHEQQTASVITKEKAIKVVVWDLDNTLWSGTLIENGIDNITLKDGIANIIQTLDQRGIINSIASKNDEDLALRAVHKFGLSEYFIFPKIGWEPKSVAVREIILDFDVGEDTIAFIDDQPFERDEVQSTLPRVRTYDADGYKNFLSLPEFNPTVSSESASRRQFYAKQMERKKAQSGFSGEYFDFLKSCEINLTICSASLPGLSRLYELTQRTNQLNFSGSRYTSDGLSQIITDPDFDSYKLACTDKFGSYGTIGFAIIEKASLTLTDMMFSCRVQSKMVEHSFLKWLAQHYAQHPSSKLTVLYTPTERNSPAAKVLEDIKFEQTGERYGRRCYVLDLTTLQSFDSPLIVQWAQE